MEKHPVERAWDEIRDNATLVEDEGHGCIDGFIEVTDSNGNFEGMARCPTCDAEWQLEKFNRQLRDSGIGDRYFQIEWDDLEMVEPLPRMKAACGRVVDIIAAGENALLHGNPGTGKTQSAVLLVKAAIRAGKTARLENLGRLSVEVRSGYADKSEGRSEARVVQDLSMVDLLVLDDIGAGETNEAKVERRILYLVTEARQNARKPTVLTTNLTPDAVGRTVGGRIVNRLQPLATVGFKHGRNFRRSDQEGLW